MHIEPVPAQPVTSTPTPSPPPARDDSPAAGLTLLTALLALWAAGYWISLKIHPYARCRRCTAGKNWGTVYPRSFGLCRHCQGTGRAPRLGTRLFATRR